MVTLELIGYSLLVAAVLAAIAVCGPRLPALLSSVSRWWDERIDEGRARRAWRASVYGRGIEPASSGIEPRVPASVLPATGAEDTGTSIPIPELTTRADYLDILARAKVDGKYLFTANKLADLFTGTAYAVSRNIILDEIANIRNPEKPAPPKHAAGRLERPARGW